MADIQNPAQKALNKEHRAGFKHGYTPVTKEAPQDLKSKNGLDSQTGIDFGIQVLKQNETLEETSAKETVWVLINGQAEIQWDGHEVFVERTSLFDEEPTALHISQGTPVKITAKSPMVEFAVSRTTNSKKFESKLFRPEDITPEYRGKGLVQGTCVRNVRLIFDIEKRKDSNLVIGEVVNFPGRWSSYPPHHHAQPEIYHYRFTLPQGYGHADLGEDVFRIQNYDTMSITNSMDHSQVSAPGYGMYYLWVVRHLDGNPYRGFEFTEEHRWILDPKNQGWEPQV